MGEGEHCSAGDGVCIEGMMAFLMGKPCLLCGLRLLGEEEVARA